MGVVAAILNIDLFNIALFACLAKATATLFIIGVARIIDPTLTFRL